MLNVTRRTAISTIAGTLFTVVVSAQTTSITASSSGALVKPFKAGRWADSVDDATVGVNAELLDLDVQISNWFGTSTGRYLADQIIYPYAPPGWRTTDRPIYDQFAAVYKGPAEFDATLANDWRMVARNTTGYRSAVFLGSDGILRGAALTFDFSPIGGVQNYVRGRRVYAETLWPMSVVLFHSGSAPNRAMVTALRGFVKNMPIPVIKEEARIMSPDGKIRIKVFSKQI